MRIFFNQPITAIRLMIQTTEQSNRHSFLYVKTMNSTIMSFAVVFRVVSSRKKGHLSTLDENRSYTCTKYLRDDLYSLIDLSEFLCKPIVLRIEGVCWFLELLSFRFIYKA